MYLAVEMLENLRHQVRLLTKNHASESAQLPETAQKTTTYTQEIIINEE